MLYGAKLALGYIYKSLYLFSDYNVSINMIYQTTVEMGYKMGPNKMLHLHHSFLVCTSPLQNLRVDVISSIIPGKIIMPIVATAHHISSLLIKFSIVKTSKTLSTIGSSTSNSITFTANTPMLTALALIVAFSTRNLYRTI